MDVCTCIGAIISWRKFFNALKISANLLCTLKYCSLSWMPLDFCFSPLHTHSVSWRLVDRLISMKEVNFTLVHGRRTHKLINYIVKSVEACCIWLFIFMTLLCDIYIIHSKMILLDNDNKYLFFYILTNDT